MGHVCQVGARPSATRPRPLARPVPRRLLILRAVHNITSTAGLVAMAAGAVALIALLLCLALMVRLRRVRSDQRVVLGDGSQDLVAHAAALRQQYEALYVWVQDVITGITQRMETVERRL